MLTGTPVLVVALWLFWGATFVAVKVALRSADPETFAMVRTAVACLAVAGVLLATRRSESQRSARGEWRAVHTSGALLGLTNVTGFFALQNFGMVEASAGASALLIYTQPMMVAIAAWLIFGEHLGPRRIVGIMLGWLGVLALVTDEMNAGDLSLAPVLLLLGAAVCWASGTILFKSAPLQVSVWSLLFWQNLYGLIPLTGLAVLRGTAPEWGMEFVIATLWAAVLGSIAGFGLQYVLLRRGEASVVSAWIFAVPLVGAALGVLMLGEPARLGLLLGALGVGLGVRLVMTSGGDVDADAGLTEG